MAYRGGIRVTFGRVVVAVAIASTALGAAAQTVMAYQTVFAAEELSGTPQIEIDPAVVLIGGEVDFADCSELAENKILDAVAIILDRLDDDAYLGCLKDAVMTDTNGFTPEKILRRLNDRMPTKITCKPVVCGNPNMAGCAGISDGAEDFTIKTSHAQFGNVVDIAATIVHEVVHRKGLGHPRPQARWTMHFPSRTKPQPVFAIWWRMGWIVAKRRATPISHRWAARGGGVFQRRCSPNGTYPGF